MIEVDDAGGGCFIGPEVMVVHCLDTGKAWFFYIPPSNNDRIEYAAKILTTAFQELGISNQEKVRLCRGELFNLLEINLKARGYSVVREKVSQATDQLAEAKFLDILYSYGFPRNLSLVNRNYQELYELVAYWYYSQEKRRPGDIRKIRIQAPFWTKKVARRFPNLLRILLEEEAG